MSLSCNERPNSKASWEGVLVSKLATGKATEEAPSRSVEPGAPFGPRRIPESESGCVVSLVKRGKALHRKLHYVGQCHLVLGVDYVRFLWLGPTKPEAEGYGNACTRCWPTGHQDRVSSSISASEDEE